MSAFAGKKEKEEEDGPLREGIDGPLAWLGRKVRGKLSSFFFSFSNSF
jgi:hypothetical protein